MATDTSQILIPARTYVHLAPVGTTAPVDASVALGAGWVNCGFTTPDSLSFSTEPEFQEVPVAQSDYPAVRFQTSESATVSVVLQQWNQENLIAVYGGGSFEEVTPATTPATYKFTPPLIGERVEKAAIIETIYGARRYRWVFPRVMQLEGVQVDLQKGQEARLPLSLGVLGGDAVAPWYLLTNDPAFDASA